MSRRQLVAYAAAALVFLAGFVTVTIVVRGPGGKPTRTVTLGQPAVATVKVDGADADVKRDDPLPLTEKAVQYAGNESAHPDVAQPLRGADSTPAGVVDGPLAAQEWPGCKTAFVRNFSSRRNTVPSAIAYHYTAGPNIAGWADLDGLTAYSDNPRNQVSWHFAVDREGHCVYNVPLNQKAWTIAGLNSQTINFEIVGTGHEPDWAGSAGMATVARITWRIHTLYPRIPIALGATDGHCNITRPGIITHWMGGPCSGGHIDIRPYSLPGVIAQVRALGTRVVKVSRLYSVVAWRPGAKAVKVKTGQPAAVVRLYARRGFTRISVVRVPAVAAH